MEREMNLPLHPIQHSGPPPSAPDLDEVRGKVEGILNAADQILNSVPHGAAEDYLQQSRQRGAQ
jgi:hypothetical protein